MLERLEIITAGVLAVITYAGLAGVVFRLTKPKEGRNSWCIRKSHGFTSCKCLECLTKQARESAWDWIFWVPPKLISLCLRHTVVLPLRAVFNVSAGMHCSRRDVEINSETQAKQLLVHGDY